jgi:hypothetical protein
VISVVVPVHDEERTVALLFDELQAARTLDQPWEVVFVDDGRPTLLARCPPSQRDRQPGRRSGNFRQAQRSRRASQARASCHDRRRSVTIRQIPRLPPNRRGFDLVSGRGHRRELPSRRAEESSTG